MTITNPPGRPPELSEEVQARIFTALPQVLIQRQVAFAAMIHPNTLNNWILRGEKDQSENIDSVYAQFWGKYHSLRAACLAEKLNHLAACPKNYGALTWTLERCFREDCGPEAQEIRELRELFTKILPLLSKGATIDEPQETTNQAEPQGQAPQGARRKAGEGYT